MIIIIHYHLFIDDVIWRQNVNNQPIIDKLIMQIHEKPWNKIENKT